MKLTKYALTAALVLAGSVLSQSAHAQTPVVYNDGDLLLGFHSTAPTDYLWDIGQFSLFNNEPVGFHLALGNINLDLTSVFGSGWQTSNAIQWGSAGTHDFDANGNEIANLYATKAEPTVGTFAQPWARQSLAAQSGSASQIETLATGGFFGNISTANNPNAIIQSTSGLSWASFNNGPQSPGTSFNTWNPTIEAPTIAGSGSGIPTTRLDLFEILPDNGGTNPPSKYIGSFSIDAAGNVSYDVFAAVPEPSTYASVIAGAVLLFVLLRFRSRALHA